MIQKWRQARQKNDGISQQLWHLKKTKITKNERTNNASNIKECRQISCFVWIYISCNNQ